jgi:polyvinyl alcohol dehydrogenase (cytochrome)
MKCEITRLALITGAVLLGAAEASRGWEAVLLVTGLDHVRQHGPSGAGIWSSPTIDEQLGVLYVATGDNYSDPPTSTSDAILAMDLKTGALLWSKQLTENDAFNTACTALRLRTVPRRNGPISIWGSRPSW